MFEQSFVHATATTRRTAPVVLSLLLQMTVIGTGILIPLINPDLLPSAIIANTLFLAPPTPPPAPPPGPLIVANSVRVIRQVRDGALLLPTRVPNTVAEIIELPESTAGIGVVGSVPGVPGGFASSSTVGSILNSIASSAPPPPAVTPKDPERDKPLIRQRVGGNVQDALVVSRILPEYPAVARSMRVQGQVVFHAVIGTAGTIQQLQLVSGNPLLVQAAMNAVRQWRYRPTMLNGDPVEVDTVISVNFTLNR